MPPPVRSVWIAEDKQREPKASISQITYIRLLMLGSLKVVNRIRELGVI